MKNETLINLSTKQNDIHAPSWMKKESNEREMKINHESVKNMMDEYVTRENDIGWNEDEADDDASEERCDE
jgi:hypothetical protein